MLAVRTRYQFVKRKDLAGALSDFNTSIKLAPGGDNEAYLKRVVVYCAQKKWQPALSSLEDMVTIARLAPAAHLVRGIVYLHLDRTDLAEYDFENAVAEYKLGYDSAVYYESRVGDWDLMAYRKLGKNSESLRTLEKYQWYKRDKDSQMGSAPPRATEARAQS